ncbi:MAG: hypothetical protein LBK82_04830, partial [Planctomycetaceae bacterium]|nr:hypothetical protein [Planctomycetaceae bacterium]
KVASAIANLPLLTVGNLIPKRKTTQFAIVNLIHCRRVRRRDLSAKGRPPTKEKVAHLMIADEILPIILVRNTLIQ